MKKKNNKPKQKRTLTKNNSVPTLRKLNLPKKDSVKEYFERIFDNTKEGYFPCDIIRYSIIIANLDENYKNLLTIHSNYSENFFKDLKSSPYVGNIFKSALSASNLASKFSKFKYEIDNMIAEGGLEFLINYLSRSEVKPRIIYE